MASKIDDYKREVPSAGSLLDRRYKNIKCFTATDESQSGLIIGEEYMELTAVGDGTTQPRGLGVHAGHGTVVRGPISLTGGFSDVRISAAWSLNPMLMTTVPSTAASPMATMVLDIPFKGLIKTVAGLKSLALLASTV